MNRINSASVVDHHIIPIFTFWLTWAPMPQYSPLLLSPDTLIFLCRIVSGIGVLKGIYIARIDPVLRVFLLLVLIEQIILVNELLHIAQL